MARIYATSCERDGKNFFDVPMRLRLQVRKIIEADGYIINEDGTVATP
jgi:hypothetical protein